MSSAEKTRGTIVIGIITFLSMFIVATMPDAMMAYFMTEIGMDLELSVRQMTSMSIVPYIGMMIIVLLASPLMDKYSAKIMAAFCLIAALSLGARGLVNSYASMTVALFFSGVAAAITYPGANKIVSLWYEKEKLLRMNAVLIAASAISFIFSLNLSGYLAVWCGGWQRLHVVMGIVMAIIAILWWVAVPEKASKDAVLNEEVGVIGAEKTSIIENCKYILKSPKVWCCMIGEMCFAGITIGVMVAYTTTAFQLSWGIDAVTGGSLQSTKNIGALFGYFLIPILLDKFMKGKDTAALAGLSIVMSCVLWMSAFFFGESNHMLVVVCMIVGGFVNGLGNASSKTYLMEQPEVAGLRSGTALGIQFFLLNIGTIIAMALVGKLFDAMPGKETIVMGCVMLVGLISAGAMFVIAILNKRDNERKTMA